MLYNTSETKLIRDCEAEQKVQGFFLLKKAIKMEQLDLLLNKLVRSV